MKCTQKIAPPLRGAIFNLEAKYAFQSSLLFFLAPVAGLNACVVQADEILAVLILFETEFQRFFRRDLRLRPVRIREARIRVFPEIARGVQKDRRTVNHVTAIDLVKKARCAAEHSRFHVAYECVSAVCSKRVREQISAIVLCLAGDGIDLIDHSQAARFPVTNN